MQSGIAPALINVQRGLWVACLVAQVLLIDKICYQRLLRRYVWFTLYLAAEVVWGVVLVQIDYQSSAYAAMFRAYQFTVIVLRFGMVAELYESICDHFNGIGRFRFGLAGVIVTVGALFSLVAFQPSLGSQWGFPHTWMVVLWRFQTSVLCISLLLTRFALHHFLNVRPPMRPNVLNHWTLTTLYFGISAMSGMAILLIGGGNAILPVNLTMLAGDLVCLLMWISWFRKDGEIIPYVPPISLEEREYHEAFKEVVIKEVERLMKDGR